MATAETTATTDATTAEETNPVDITIGAYDAATQPPSVPVTFIYAGVTHQRNVNACLDAAGAYDAAATAERVIAVGNGVKYKIKLGALVNLPPEPEAPGPVAQAAEEPETDADDTPAT
ncbi:hypothetical protein [Novosphingobium sp.]|uniref:hypothetical protein n=1 Tax=Novosphingobium sp. TaxID=1874826 RepID=UPI0031DD7870